MRMGNHLGNTTYQCMQCRLAQRAEVRVVSLPRQNEIGRHHANTAMAMLLALKRCPHCGHYDRDIAAHNRHNVRAGLITYTVVLALVALTLFAIPAVPRLALAITGGVFVVGFVWLALHLRSKWPVDAESRVTLLGATSLPRQWW